MGTYKDLTVYKKGFSMAMEIFEISKLFPVEERYSLTDQIRRSSRAICANVAEAYRKRRYQAYFVNRVSDADMENTETQTWLQFAKACGYLSEATFMALSNKSEEIGKLLGHMMINPEKYIGNTSIKPGNE